MDKDKKELEREERENKIIEILMDWEGNLSDGYEWYLDVGGASAMEDDVKEGLRPLAQQIIKKLNQIDGEDEKIKKIEKWAKNYAPDFWETRGKQFQYGFNYFRNDLLIAIKELLRTKKNEKEN